MYCNNLFAALRVKQSKKKQDSRSLRFTVEDKKSAFISQKSGCTSKFSPTTIVCSVLCDKYKMEGTTSVQISCSVQMLKLNCK